MSFFLRRNTLPSLQEITSVPQIVVVDQTGPTISLGTAAGIALIVGEFVKGPLVPTEVGSGGEQAALYGAVVYPYFSQSAGGIQDGSAAAYNGNGNLQLLNRTFRRLGICRVDHEAVTADAGTTRGQLSVTVTVALADQDGSGNTAKDITIPAGARFGSASTFAASTRVFGASGDTVIPKGTALTTNAVTVQINCFPIRVVEPVVATAASAIAFVLDAALSGVSTGTSITVVTNATTLWPQGTGTTLATRLETKYQDAITACAPGSDVTSSISVIWAARRTSAIRTALVAGAVTASEMGKGRLAIVAADPAAAGTAVAAAAAKAAAIALASSDGYAQPADRAIITFPHSKEVVKDFGNVKVTIASDGRMASTLSNFAEEVNPGATNAFIQDIAELEDAFVASPLAKPDYDALIAGGVCALYKDRKVGWQWMQGVTAASATAFPTRVPIKRRRMADLIQDTIGELSAPYQKEPATVDRVDSLAGAIVSFLETLKSSNAPAAARIVDYKVDPDSGNTADLQALGINVLVVYVRILASMDYIVFNTTIGETVTIPTNVTAAA